MRVGILCLSVVASLLASPSLARGKLRGSVRIDGSSTVYPVAEAVAEEFLREEPRVRVTVGLSGTGGGFKKFAAGELDISTASRPIKDSEKAKLAAKKLRYMEIPVAYDGISVVLSPSNKFATKLTLEELKKIWQPGSKVKTWQDLRPEFPREPIKLYGPGADSGTFDFFTTHVMGKAKSSRSDYVSSEDDNVLVRGVSADRYSMGYFGYAYYYANKSRLRLAALSRDGKEFVEPNAASIESARYPLSRPLLIYVNLDAAKREELAKFVEFFIQNAASLAKEVGYIPLPKETYENSLAAFKKAIGTGTTH